MCNLINICDFDYRKLFSFVASIPYTLVSNTHTHTRANAFISLLLFLSRCCFRCCINLQQLCGYYSNYCSVFNVQLLMFSSKQSKEKRFTVIIMLVDYFIAIFWCAYFFFFLLSTVECHSHSVSINQLVWLLLLFIDELLDISHAERVHWQNSSRNQQLLTFFFSRLMNEANKRKTTLSICSLLCLCFA